MSTQPYHTLLQSTREYCWMFMKFPRIPCPLIGRCCVPLPVADSAPPCQLASFLTFSTSLYNDHSPAPYCKTQLCSGRASTPSYSCIAFILAVALWSSSFLFCSLLSFHSPFAPRPDSLSLPRETVLPLLNISLISLSTVDDDWDSVGSLGLDPSLWPAL